MSEVLKIVYEWRAKGICQCGDQKVIVESVTAITDQSRGIPVSLIICQNRLEGRECCQANVIDPNKYEEVRQRLLIKA